MDCPDVWVCFRKYCLFYKVDCIQFTFMSGRESVNCWAVIGYNFKSRLLFLSTEGQGKGLTQAKYETQVLRGELGDICTRLHEEN